MLYIACINKISKNIIDEKWEKKKRKKVPESYDWSTHMLFVMNFF